MISKLPRVTRPPTIRAANLPGSGVGAKRYALYASAYKKISVAFENGFYIECIAICESIIADRLEARRACLNPKESDKHRFSNLGKLAEKLWEEETSDDKAVRSLYVRIDQWREKRNIAVHQIVKQGEKESTEEWTARYQSLQATVDEGVRLCREISKIVKRLNSKDRSAESNQRELPVPKTRS